jgi:hypothetical protein
MLKHLSLGHIALAAAMTGSIAMNVQGSHPPNSNLNLRRSGASNI